MGPGPSEDFQGPKKGLSGPKRTLFACFLELGGSIWAITVLNEPGIPLRRSGHPTSLCLTSAGPSGAVGTKSGPLGPSEDLGAPQKGFSGQNRSLLRSPGAQKGPDIRSKCVLTMSLTQAHCVEVFLMPF